MEINRESLVNQSSPEKQYNNWFWSDLLGQVKVRTYTDKLSCTIQLICVAITSFFCIFLISCEAYEVPQPTHPPTPASTPLLSTIEPIPDSYPRTTLSLTSTLTQSTTEANESPAIIDDDICKFEVEEEKDNFRLGHRLVYLVEGGRGLLLSDEVGNFHHWLSPFEVATFNAISPDGDWLVYRRENEIVVTSSNEDDEIVYPWDEAWLELWGWVSPTQIAIRHDIQRGTDLFVVFSPFTNPPSVETLEFPWQFIPEFSNPVFFSPDFNLVLYPKGLSIAVANVTTAIDVWEKPVEDAAIGVLGGGADWSPDSELIAIGLSNQPESERLMNELTILTKDGELIFQTDYHNNFESFTVRSPKWSPNGRYISFWLIFPGAENHPLQIYDTLSGEFLDLCLVNPSPSALEWSFDNEQIAYITELNHLVVYDLQSKQAVRLAQDVLRLIGWIDG